MFKVVLVDDEIYARQGLKQFTDWSKHGFDIIAEAANGEEALHIIEQTAPDLVVTDIRMPELDGLQLIQAVKEQTTLKPIFVIISGYNDFSYAQQAVRFGVEDFILKPIDEEEMEQLLAKLNVVLSKRREEQAERSRAQIQFYFEQMINGRMPLSMTGEAEEALQLRGRKMRYVEIEFNNCDLVPGTVSQPENLLETINRLYGPGERYIHKRQSGIYSLLAADPSMEFRGRGSWGGFLRDFYDRLIAAFGTHVYLYAGQVARDVCELHDSYRSTLQLRAYKYAVPELQPFIYEELQSVQLQYSDLEDTLFSRLMEAIEEQEENKAFDLLDQLYVQFREQHFSESAVSRAVSRLLYGVARIIEAMQGNVRELPSFHAINEWSQSLVTLDGLRVMVMQFVKESIRLIGELRKANGKGNIQKIRQYIEAHYNESISLKSIAAQFYMNPVYLGQLFKKTQGMYFNDFLLHIRMREAKRLLRQTELRIYEIADQVGFSNSDYFVTQFEKVVQKTPSEYRNELHAKT
ncbi:DNA-binding response regulator [Paenibacillus sp. 598K]|uniref:response regulator transcription factor n=1 Tax=Paenibacillus sp. 598K TaxID=1117987 RepID=UPI000FF9693D|nr:response regulator transcription factor [Paenibacillus sp. 598K]GBF72674.1 DNA-binding response regulator [Paenibacillus sp. 598K]